MNKKIILILLLIPILLISTTSCGNNSISKKNKDKITFKDEDNGYTTNLYYGKKDNYTDISQKISKPTTMSFTNKDLDVEFQMSYSTYSSKTFNKVKNARKDHKNFQEFKFNNYQAYTYGNYDETINMIILLESSKKKEVDLNISITRIDDNIEVIAKDVVNNKKVQDLLNSLEFDIEKKK